jgi:signal transduction histidine kinase
VSGSKCNPTVPLRWRLGWVPPVCPLALWLLRIGLCAGWLAGKVAKGNSYGVPLPGHGTMSNPHEANQDEERKLHGYVKVMRDITDGKRAETELAEANRRKDEFLAMLAHELRNPLLPSVNGIQILGWNNQ